MKTSKGCILMMADDDPDDREFVREAFDQCGFDGEFRYVEDGAELIDYLIHEGRYCEAPESPRPDLILLDLNMPRVDGREALSYIKENPSLRKIPVVVLSTSDSADDIQRSYDLGVNSFLTKPNNFDEIVKLAKRLQQYWLETVRLPSNT